MSRFKSAIVADLKKKISMREIWIGQYQKDTLTAEAGIVTSESELKELRLLLQAIETVND